MDRRRCKAYTIFLWLGSRNFTSKIIPKIEKEDGTIVTNQFDILKEAKLFCDNPMNRCTVNTLKYVIYKYIFKI